MHADLKNGIVYSARRVGEWFGVSTANTPAPSPKPGCLTVWMPSITNVNQLRESSAGQHLTRRVHLYDNVQFGFDVNCYYDIVLPVADNLTDEEATQLISGQMPGFQRTPVLLDAFAWCVHKLATGQPLFDNMIIRSSEGGYYGLSILLCVTESGLLDFSVCPGLDKQEGVCASAYRLSTSS